MLKTFKQNNKEYTVELPDSILVKAQSKTLLKKIIFEEKPAMIEVKLRYDDECGNKHNSFAITGSIYR